MSRSNRFSAVMEQHLTVVHQSTEECMCTCPFCEGKASLGFNDVKGVWICFRCGEKGTAKSLVEKLQGVYTEPEVALEALSRELRSLERDVQSGQKSLPESYLRRFHQPGRVHPLWRERGFNRAACDRWELGYDFLTARLALPFRDPFTRELTGVIFRATDGSIPRYQYPKGFSRSSSLYGSWLVGAGPAHHVQLVEGPTDAIRVDQAGGLPASQYGSSLSLGQVRLLHRLGITSATFFFDYDRAGLAAVRKAEKVATEFVLDKVVWDNEKYCWHRYVCGCASKTASPAKYKIHTYEISKCDRRKSCRCGRIHEPDPGGLELKEIDGMLGRTVEL